VDLVKAYLARIDEASEFKAVLQVNPEALIAAQHLDEERLRSGSKRLVNCLVCFSIILIGAAHSTEFPFW
jgi:Asp-tRNA(Asn)/Glu-tRNA(Gln) amidotransferase A subunit family amidase